MDPMSVDRLFRIIAGVVDVITAIAALLLAVVLTARLRMSSGMSKPLLLEQKRQSLGAHSQPPASKLKTCRPSHT
jgi:hypothetical protein